MELFMFLLSKLMKNIKDWKEEKLNIRKFYTYLISEFAFAIKLINLAQLCAELMNVGCRWCEFIV